MPTCGIYVCACCVVLVMLMCMHAYTVHCSDLCYIEISLCMSEVGFPAGCCMNSKSSSILARKLAENRADISTRRVWSSVGRRRPQHFGQNVSKIF